MDKEVVHLYVCPMCSAMMEVEDEADFMPVCKDCDVEMEFSATYKK